MKKNLLESVILLLTTSVLFACSQTPSSTPEPTPIVTTSTATPIAPTATPTFEPSSTVTATLLPTPTDQGDCVNYAEFVSDVNVPDYTKFNPGDKFTKTWRILNTGSCIWNSRYSLVFVKGTQMSELYSSPFTETLPGNTIDASIEIVAPAQDGVYTGSYQIQAPSGLRFAMKDGNIWVRIIVGSGTATPATFTPAATSLTPGETSTPNPTSAGQNGSCTYLANPDFTTQVITLINQARADNGLPPYKFNNLLAAAAQKHSIDMGCNNFLAHSGSDGSTAKSRILAEGYSASSVQEAIYAQPPQFGGTPQTAVDWWLNDAQHRPILLSSKLTEIGVGYVNVSASDLGGYFTVDMATP